MNKTILLFTSLVLMIACQTVKSPKGIAENSPEASVIKFLNFYNSHLNDISNFRFVNEINPNDSNDFYRINYSQTDKYLDLLLSSGCISESYIKAQKQYFKNCDLEYQKTHQNDGPPAGLEADLVMIANADIEEELAKLDSIKVIKSEINGNKAKVILQFIYNDKKTYDLSLKDKTWQIDKIENLIE
ncbi:MAG TPA: hypothetical protein VIH57_05650 [Bacteroidales bacterium]